MTNAPVPTLFILGAARSGTTLLYKCVCLHPRAAYISNWVRRYPTLPQLALLNRIARADPGRARRMWFGTDSNAYAYGRARAMLERAFPAPVEGEPVFANCGIPEASDGLASADQTKQLRTKLAALTRWAGGSLFVSKRISHIYRVRLLHSIFPDARFVVITRDGRAVANSLSQVDWWRTGIVSWYGGTPEDWERENRDPWELCAKNWVEEVRAAEAGLSKVPEKQVLRVRYEDLLANPELQLGKVVSFAGLPANDGWLDRIGELSFPNRNERWRTQMPAKAISLTESIQGTELRRLGYLEGASVG